MVSKSIGYHTRLVSDNRVKVVGGSFGGDISMDTVNRLISGHFEVVVKSSGTPVFVDTEGREVRVYISVDASETIKGKAAIVTHRAEEEAARRVRKAIEEAQEKEIEELISGLSHEEIVKRLRG